MSRSTRARTKRLRKHRHQNSNIQDFTSEDIARNRLLEISNELNQQATEEKDPITFPIITLPNYKEEQTKYKSTSYLEKGNKIHHDSIVTIKSTLSGISTRLYKKPPKLDMSVQKPSNSVSLVTNRQPPRLHFTNFMVIDDRETTQNHIQPRSPAKTLRLFKGRPRPNQPSADVQHNNQQPTQNELVKKLRRSNPLAIEALLRQTKPVTQLVRSIYNESRNMQNYESSPHRYYGLSNSTTQSPLSQSKGKYNRFQYKF